jgi:hypothetical protein
MGQESKTWLQFLIHLFGCINTLVIYFEVLLADS